MNKKQLILNYFRDLHVEQFDQAIGQYGSGNNKCCVGAHLAHLLLGLSLIHI